LAKSSETLASEPSYSLRQAFDKKTMILIGFAVIALLFYLFLEKINIFNMLNVILDANLVLLIIGAIFTFIAVLCDALAWKILMGISSINPSLLSTYRVQLSSFSYGLLIPSAGAVEAVMRVALGTQEFVNERDNRNATSGEILSSVVAHKLCGLLSFIPISAFVSIAILQYLSAIVERRSGVALSTEFAILFVAIISLISILVLTLIALIAKSPIKANRFISVFLQMLSRLPFIGNYAEKAIIPSQKIVEDFGVQFSYLAQNKLLSVMALILTFLSQVAHWGSILFILHAINIPIFLDQVAAVNFLGGTVDFIPVGIPGMAGLKEISLSVFLKEANFGISSTLATSGAILVQLVKFYFLIIVGILVYILGKTRIKTHTFNTNETQEL